MHAAARRSRTGRGAYEARLTASTGWRGPTRRAPRWRSSRCSARRGRGWRRRTSSAARWTRSSAATHTCSAVRRRVVRSACSGSSSRMPRRTSRLTGERMLADLAQPVVPSSAAALARLLRAQPAGVIISRLTKRRRGASTARDDGVTSLVQNSLTSSYRGHLFSSTAARLATLVVMPLMACDRWFERSGGAYARAETLGAVYRHTRETSRACECCSLHTQPRTRELPPGSDRYGIEHDTVS